MQNTNAPRIGFRPNIYSRGQHAMPPPSRLPTTINRMLKPGFEPSSSSYDRTPKTAPPERKEKQKIFEAYPILSSFMFTDEELKNTPSHRIHNISYEEEITLRRVGTFSIRELTRRLNAPYEDKRYKISARAMCVAMIYFHRFYMYHSITTFNPTQLGTACLFLATKCEECPRKLSHFSKQLYSMMHPDDLKLLEDDELEPMNDLITTLETSVLRTLGFELKIDLPHVDVIQTNFTTPNDCLRKTAYTFSTDILVFTTLCIQHESKTLAAACFFAAAAYLEIDMRAGFGERWYTKIDENLTEETLVKVVKKFTDAMLEVKPLMRAERIQKPESSKNEQSKTPSSEQHPHVTHRHLSSAEHKVSSGRPPRVHPKAPTEPSDTRKSHEIPRKSSPSSTSSGHSRHRNERTPTDQKSLRQIDIEAPLLLPPPLAPPSSEIRKRKAPLKEEVTSKRPVDSSHVPSKHSFRPEQMDFSIPPPPLPPPESRRQSIHIREVSSAHRHQPSSSNTSLQQSSANSVSELRNRDESRNLMAHSLPRNSVSRSNPIASVTIHPQQSSHHIYQKEVRKREIVINTAVAQSFSRRPPPTADELEEGEIE